LQKPARPHIYIGENIYAPSMKTSGLDSIKSTLKNRKSVLKRRYKVRRIGIFGSYARGEQKRASDVDVLVELSEPIGLDLIALKNYLEKALGREVDLVTVKALKARMRDGILAEVVYV
jgi:predicted nucleotidyltransferase